MLPGRAPPALLLCLFLGCASSSQPGSAPASSETLAFSYLTNLIPVDVTVNGATGNAFVDTGNPLVLLDPLTFPSVENLPASGGLVSSITLGTRSVSNVYALPSNAGLTSPDPAFPLGGNIGCSAICSLVASFDYRGAAFGLGPAAPALPAGVEPATSVAFSFLGGGVVDGVTIPRSRIVVNVSLEGNQYAMILDTGATSVTVSQAAFTALTADGRTQIMTGGVETTSGVSTTSLARAASIAVGGVTVDSVVVAHDTSFDTNLAAVSMDAGQTIDGSLGGDFLHDFFVTVDYAASTVHLARYSDLSFAVDEAEEIGIALEAEGNGYVVSGVSTTAGAQGITVGDTVESIDDVDLAGLSLAQATLLLYGKVGSTKVVKFGAAQQVANQTLTVVVEEFLPLK
jgi:hypothetical protein